MQRNLNYVAYKLKNLYATFYVFKLSLHHYANVCTGAKHCIIDCQACLVIRDNKIIGIYLYLVYEVI